MKKLKDIDGILNHKYTAIYLNKTKDILVDNGVKNNSVMRFCHFHKEPIYVCGVEHVVQILKNIKGNFHVYGVKDGALVKAGQPILVITGDYSKVAQMESVIDGLIARESSICNTVKNTLTIIKPEQLVFMADRADLYLTQPYDGYAAWKAGCKIFTTPAHIELIEDKSVKAVGTMPHALIQQCGGNLSLALWAYHNTFKQEKLCALVDYHNDVVNEIKHIDPKLRKLIGTIRIDTSASMCDKSLKNKLENYGVCKQLVINARKALDANGMKHVKIIVSSGFTNKKIKDFINHKVPVDKYGIGSSLVKVDVNITGDLVYLNNKKEAKSGRNLGIELKSIKKLNIYI